MTRKLLCSDCDQFYRKHAGVDPAAYGGPLPENCDRPPLKPALGVLDASDDGPMEVTLFLVGEVPRGKAFRCDLCNRTMYPGDEIVAATTVSEGQKYLPWEGECLALTNESWSFREQLVRKHRSFA